MPTLYQPTQASIHTAWQTLQQEIAPYQQHRAVQVVAATKYLDAAGIRLAYQAGIRLMGENRVMDALEKMEHCPPAQYPALQWHFIGHLQKNKVSKVLGRFALIHSVDSLALAQVLSEKNSAAGHPPQAVLLQVNVSKEDSKSGFSASQLQQDIQSILALPGIEVQGLMTMAPLESDEAGLAHCFGGLATLRDQLQSQTGHALSQLSMGMSQDYSLALRYGATIIRVGSQLFR